jgi:hypothetical protein
MAPKSGFSRGWKGFVDHKWSKKSRRSVVLDAEIQGGDYGVVFFQLSTRLAEDDSVFGGSRCLEYRRRKARTYSFTSLESSSARITTHVSNCKDASDSGLTTTPSALKPCGVGSARIATPTRSETRSTACCGDMVLCACFGMMEFRRAVSMIVSYTSGWTRFANNIH